MRILHIHDKPPGGGGIRALVEQAVRVQRAAGIDALALRLGPSSVADDQPSAARTFWPHQGLLHRSAIIATISALRPDVLHLHAGFTAMAPSVLAEVARFWPTLGTLHDVVPFCPNKLRRFQGGDRLCTETAGNICIRSGCWRLAGQLPHVRQRLLGVMRARLRRLWLGLGVLAVPSRYLAGLAVQHGASAGSVEVVPNFTGLPDLVPLPAEPRLLFVGALTQAKGADLFVEALALLAGDPRWAADIVGAGGLEEQLRERCRATGIAGRVQFHGHITGEALAAIRNRASIGVFSSRIVESFGLAGLESLAAGRPVVGVADGGAADWLRDGETGLAMRSGDGRGLASSLARLLDDPALLAQLGCAGRQLVGERFSAAGYVAATSRLYALAKSGKAELAA